jgi:hypothetical protein
MQEHGDAAGAGPSPASKGFHHEVVNLAKGNCQPMPATASNKELAVVRAAVNQERPINWVHLASRGVALPAASQV